MLRKHQHHRYDHHSKNQKFGHCCSAQRCSGFTLMEVMLVVIIIGVMAGMSTLAIGGNQSRLLEQEASRLQQRLMLAQDQAIFTQTNLGLQFTEKGYRFLKYEPVGNVWHPFTAPKEGTNNHYSKHLTALSSYEYQVSVVISLELEGTPLTLHNQQPSSLLHVEDTQEHPEPELILLANGESSAFTLTLEMKDDQRLRQTLHSDGFSPIKQIAVSSRPNG